MAAASLHVATGRTRRLLAIVLTIGLTLSLTHGAEAQPSSSEVRTDLRAAQERLDELDEQRGQALEAFNAAQEALDGVNARLAATHEELSGLRVAGAALTLVVEDHVRTLHKLGPAIELSSITIAGDPFEAGIKSATLRRILDGRRTDLEALEATRTAVAAAEQRLADEQDQAAQRAAELEQRREELEARFAANEAEIQQLRALLAERLAAEEEARRQEEERLRQLAIQREAERRAAQQVSQRRATAQRATQPSRTTATSTATQTSAPPAASAPARASADVAVQTALAQLGKPYRWGGSGPNNFDCSGLTSYAWRAAGVSLPRTSRAQFSATTRISRADLRPGDLVFYHSPISHVAMYIGDGKVVEAPNSGNNVRIRTDGLTRRGVVGFGRP